LMGEKRLDRIGADHQYFRVLPRAPPLGLGLGKFWTRTTEQDYLEQLEINKVELMRPT
jgi:hypothetical protein